MPSDMHTADDVNLRIVKRLVKLTCFIAVLFTLFFCITWQNIQVQNMNRKLKELSRVRNELEKSIYLKNLELSGLISRERMRKIAVEELGMVPITYRDVKVIVY